MWYDDEFRQQWWQSELYKLEQSHQKMNTVSMMCFILNLFIFFTQPHNSFPLTAVSLLSIYESVSVFVFILFISSIYESVSVFVFILFISFHVGVKSYGLVFL